MGTELMVRHDHAPDGHAILERDHGSNARSEQSGTNRFVVSGDPLALATTAFELRARFVLFQVIAHGICVILNRPLRKRIRVNGSS